MFKMLDSLHHTAEGEDGIPAWLLRLAATVLVSPLAHLVNLSLNTATVPKQWKTAVIRPMPKVSQPKVPADYRPISIASQNCGTTRGANIRRPIPGFSNGGNETPSL